MNRKSLVRVLFIAVAIVVVVAGGYVSYKFVLPALGIGVGAAPTGVPTAQGGGLRATLTAKAATAAAVTQTPTLSGTQALGNGILPVAYRPNVPTQKIDNQALYESCITARKYTPTPASAGPVPTAAATAAATPAAASTPSAEAAVIIYRVVKEESEACFQVGEILRGEYRLVVGVTKEIDGEVAVDRTNLANTLMGDEIIINIAQLATDEPMRNNWFRSGQGYNLNKFPLAKLTEANLIGLPSTPYKDGDVVEFKIAGKLLIREAKRDVVFSARAVLKDGTLVVNAYTDIKLTNFDMEPPALPMVTANDDVRIVLNLVLREAK